MRAIVIRSGGFAGMVLRAEVVAEQLDPPLREELARLIEVTNFFNLPARIEVQEAVYDRFHFEILVERSDHMHLVVTSDSGMDDALNELVRFIMRVGR
jgi:hypothetical protein